MALSACQPKSETSPNGTKPISPVASNTTAQVSGQERGGGDARRIRSAILVSHRAKLITSVVTAYRDDQGVLNVRNFLAWFNRGTMRLHDEAQQKILEDMITRGFGKNLMKTKFVMTDSCVDSKGDSKTAVAEMNQPAGDICVSPSRIVDDFGPYIQDSDIMGLMMHELAHHYGYEDADHSFAAAIADEYQRDNEEKNQDGMPLNYLVR